jgi:hypothetical protein
MPRQMHASIAVDLNSDEFEEAAEKLKIRPIWEKLITELTAAGIKFIHKRETIETRAKPATNGTRAPRRTKAQMQADKAASAPASEELGV